MLNKLKLYKLIVFFITFIFCSNLQASADKSFDQLLNTKSSAELYQEIDKLSQENQELFQLLILHPHCNAKAAQITAFFFNFAFETGFERQPSFDTLFDETNNLLLCVAIRANLVEYLKFFIKASKMRSDQVIESLKDYIGRDLPYLVSDYFKYDYLNSKSNKYESLPLQLACENQNFDICKILVESGANLIEDLFRLSTDFVHSKLLSPTVKLLNYSILKANNLSQKVIVLGLGRRGAVTPIMCAVWMNNFDLLELLLDGNVDLNNPQADMTNSMQITPIRYAIQNGKEYLRILNLLLSKADPNIESISSPIKSNLHYTVYWGEIEILNILLDSPNTNINILSKVDDKLQTALSLANSDNFASTVNQKVRKQIKELLLSKGAK